MSAGLKSCATGAASSDLGAKASSIPVAQGFSLEPDGRYEWDSHFLLSSALAPVRMFFSP
jgi:hypothetical protein